jgi:hypothetical protein
MGIIVALKGVVDNVALGERTVQGDGQCCQ